MTMTNVGVLAHERKTLGKGLEELRAALADAGFADPPWCEVAKSKEAPKKVRRLLEQGIDRLLVWGGDGTVRRCLDTIVAEDAKVEVGILPAGTANLLAHALGVPIDLAGAVDVALHGSPRPIDIGVINGEMFAVMAGTGFDALMIRDAEDGMKDRFGRLSYIRTGARNLDASGADVTIKVDGDTWFEGRAACVLVGNTGRILGGIDAFPDAQFDDGLLDVGVVTAQSRVDWLRVGLRAVTGHIDASPMVEITQGRRVKIRLDRTMPWELDGGDRPRAKKFDVSVLPGRVPICVPAS
ncbi:MAG: diacylglycerol kinase family protein [Acidimicrobiia bacterium]